MDKITKYKNLNESVNKLFRKEFVEDLREEYELTAQELVESLEDPTKVNMLLRTGLVDPSRLSRVRTALKDPDKAMKNTAIRSDLVNMLMSLINIITTNPGVFQKVRKTAKDTMSSPGKLQNPVSESISESINPRTIDTKGHYAIYTHSGRKINDIMGPYSSEKEAYDDHGGDVDDIFTGAELIKKLKKGEYKGFKLKTP